MTVLFLQGIEGEMSRLASMLGAKVVLASDLFFDEGRDHHLNSDIFSLNA